MRAESNPLVSLISDTTRLIVSYVLDRGMTNASPRHEMMFGLEVKNSYET